MTSVLLRCSSGSTSAAPGMPLRMRTQIVLLEIGIDANIVDLLYIAQLISNVSRCESRARGPTIQFPPANKVVWRTDRKCHSCQSDSIQRNAEYLENARTHGLWSDIAHAPGLMVSLQSDAERRPHPDLVLPRARRRIGVQASGVTSTTSYRPPSPFPGVPCELVV